MEASPQQVCDDFLALMGRIKIALMAGAERHELTPSQFWALHTLANGATTTGQLAERMHCDASNITGIIDRLVGRGLVTRQESAADRRAKLLALTAQGQHTITDIRAHLPVQLGCVKLSRLECTKLHELLGKVL